MPTATPSGCRIEYASTRVDTFSEYEPLSRCGIPQAKSTTSRPLATSPAASLATLPCSELIRAASWSVWVRTSSRKENMTWLRRARDAFRQPAAASAAADTAASTSSADAKSTVPVTWPVAGS